MSVHSVSMVHHLASDSVGWVTPGTEADSFHLACACGAVGYHYRTEALATAGGHPCGTTTEAHRWANLCTLTRQGYTPTEAATLARLAAPLTLGVVL